MPETACLHIQARDSDPIRVVELAGSSVRIGRASYCEVRLSEPDLADEECRLKRRGGTWQLVPSRAAGFIWIDGQSVEATCPLPFDVPFRVGEHWLTLRPTGSATPEWHAYKTPEPSASTLIREEVHPPVAASRDRDQPSDLFAFTPPPPRPASTPEYDHLSRWKVQQEKRVSRSNLSPEERRWENRWRAAGERVRTRPTVKATPIATPPLATPPVAPPPPLPTTPPRVSPSPIPATPNDESALRRATFGAADLRERARRGTAPLDRRVTITEVPPVPPVVPPLPTLTPPLVENVPRTTAPYHAPELPRTDLPAVENRVGAAPASEWPADPNASTSDTLSALLLAPSGPTPREPAVDSVCEPAVPAEPLAVANSVVSPAELEDVSSDEIQAVDDLLVPDKRLEAPVVNDVELEAESLESLESGFFAAEAEFRAAAAAELEVDSLESVEADSVAPDEALRAVAEESGITVTEDPAAAAAEELKVPVAPEEREIPASVEELESSVTQANAVPQVEAETATPAATATVTEPIVTDRGFVANVSPADSNEAILTKSHVDLTTSVHDACGLPRTASAAVHRPGPETDHPTTQPPGAAAAHTGLPATEWTPPADASPRRETGSTTGEPLPPPSSRDWPTVRDILASHAASVKRASAARPKTRSVPTQPILTELREPAHWSFPVWLGWPPAVIAVLVFGLAGFALSWTWSVDARWAGSVARNLAGGGANVKALPETVPAPDGSWWKSTPTNLMLWSIYFDRRAVLEPENAEAANKLLATAAQASPVQAQVRFAMARGGVPQNPAPGSALTLSLGLSRDIEAQTWLGRQLLQAGKHEAALKVYRGALEMAVRADPARLAPPAFDDDTQVLRYYLPGEDVAGRVIRDMADQTNWTFTEWKEALPSFALIPLSAARLLRERGSSDADVALDLILTRLDAPPPEGASVALHRAAQAEALAWKSRWEEAESHYREAIEQMPIETIKRSWWMNLAEIDRRLNDDAGRLVALGFAKGIDVNDEISQRAVDLLRFGGTRPNQGRDPQ